MNTVTKGWAGRDLLGCGLNALPNGQIAGAFYSYGSGGQVTDKKEYDYGQITSAGACFSGAVAPTGITPARETVTTYQPFPNPSWYSAPIILDRPCKIVTNGNGSAVAETDLYYDGSANLCGSGATVGNATKILKKCLQSAPACTSGDTIATYAYDSHGQVTSTTDPCGNATCSDMAGTNHTTTYSYTDVYSSCGGNAPPSGSSPTDAYLTQITYPQTNGVNHIVNYCYDYSTGLLLSSSDENAQVTNYKFNDTLNRLTETDSPDGGQTTIAYNDAAPTSVTTNEKLNSSGQLVTKVATMDGFGHVTQTKITSDPAGTDYTSTIYDGLGRVYQATNAYRSTSDQTYGVTTYTYDALGRTTLTRHPDGSTIQTTYANRATEVTDEGSGTKSVQRISQIDGLGRLNFVCEITGTTIIGNANSGTPAACGLDISGTGFLTTYSYDALGNLTAVAQGGLNGRSFTYDSLSRLTQASNPESGTTTYAYDANGNVAAKTDARSITTAYTYDVLNRLIQKGYQNDPSGTPAVKFNYDQPTGWNSTQLYNSIGRLTTEGTSTACTYSSTTACSSVLSYDQMGRTTNRWDKTPSSSTIYGQTASYDLLGDVISATNAMGTTFTYSLNAAAQLTSMTSSWNDSQHPASMISGVTYNAFGAMTAASLGNGLTESLMYGNRGQLQSETVSNGSGATPATGLLTVTGSEQVVQQQASSSTSTIIIAGDCSWGCNGGTVSVTVGSHQSNANYGSYDSALTVAYNLANALNNSGLVSAQASNVTSGVAQIVMTSTATGSNTNYSVSCNGNEWDMSQCPDMSGGQDASSVNDSGTITLTVNGHSDSASYGSSSTPSSLASALATAINSDTNAAVTAAASGYIVSLTTKASGAGANYVLTTSSHSNNPPSGAAFAMSSSGPALIGGTGGYGFALLYAPNGNLLAANDSVNGNWTYGYDDFNRLTGSACSLHCPDGQNTQGFTYDYDRYANRWHQYVAAGSGFTSSLSFSGNNNRMDGYSYDASGNLLNDGTHSYAYDAESRIISVDSGSTATYVYDVEGRRVQKTSAAGAVSYVYDLAGRQMGELNSSGAWNRAEVYVGGHHLATYSYVGGTTLFDHADWLGTERARSAVSGSVCETIVSLPFGDGQATSGSCGDASPMHFTGKPRDAETNLDDFDARYYSSTLGRFISADWSAVPEPVPYAHLGNPQTLNLYAIVADNLVTFADLDGHDYDIKGVCNCSVSTLAQVREMVNYAMPGGFVRGDINSGSIYGEEGEYVGAYKYCDHGTCTEKQASAVDLARAVLAEFARGVWDSTGKPLVDTVEHPIKTAKETAETVAAITEPTEHPWKVLDMALSYYFWGKEVQSGNPRALGQAVGVVVDLELTRRAVLGKELNLGDNLRIAPTGNRTGHPIGRFPHYHRRIIGPGGETVEGGSMKWHRPWEKGW